MKRAPQLFNVLSVILINQGQIMTMLLALGIKNSIPEKMMDGLENQVKATLEFIEETDWA